MLRSKPDQLSVLMSTLLSQAKSSQAPLVFVPLIGLVVDVTIRLKEKSLTKISSENKVRKINSLIIDMLTHPFWPDRIVNFV